MAEYIHLEGGSAEYEYHSWDGQVYTRKETDLTDGFITRDSGQREDFASGARRDTQDGKPRYDLIPPRPLKRLAELMARGAEKYGDSNWTLGMPSSRFLASLMRHQEAYRLGDRTEDHLAAVAFNAFSIMYFEGSEWDDLNQEAAARPLWTGDGSEEPPSYVQKALDRSGDVVRRCDLGGWTWGMHTDHQGWKGWTWGKDAAAYGPYTEVRD